MSTVNDARPSAADEFLDDLLPAEFDWKRVVRTYPIPALAVAGLAGYLLGRAKGREIVGALAGWAVSEMSAEVNEMLGDEVL